MQQFQELGDYIACLKQQFEQVVCQNQVVNLYIHKQGLNKVLVRAPKAQKKIHCWRLKTLQITQYSCEKGTSQKAVAQINFDGEMIFTHIDLFNQKMCAQIIQYVQSLSSQLKKWCSSPIKNVFLLTERMEQSFGFKHGFAKVQPILYYQNRIFYFQYRRWIGQIQSQIPQIQNAEHVKGTSCYSYMFESVCRSIREQRKQQKQIERQKQQELKRKYKAKMQAKRRKQLEQQERLQKQRRQKQFEEMRRKMQYQKQLERKRKQQQQKQKQQNQQDKDDQLKKYYKMMEKKKSPSKYDSYTFTNLGANVFDIRIKYLEYLKQNQKKKY